MSRGKYLAREGTGSRLQSLCAPTPRLTTAATFFGSFRRLRRVELDRCRSTSRKLRQYVSQEERKTRQLAKTTTLQDR